MVKIALVISTIILGFFSLVIAGAYSYLYEITDRVENSTLAGQWTLVGTEFLIGSLVLVFVFIVRSRKQ